MLVTNPARDQAMLVIYEELQAAGAALRGELQVSPETTIHYM
jgi:hypothetical protein